MPEGHEGDPSQILCVVDQVVPAGHPPEVGNVKQLGGKDVPGGQVAGASHTAPLRDVLAGHDKVPAATQSKPEALNVIPDGQTGGASH